MNNVLSITYSTVFSIRNLPVTELHLTLGKIIVPTFMWLFSLLKQCHPGCCTLESEYFAFQIKLLLLLLLFIGDIISSRDGAQIHIFTQCLNSYTELHWSMEPGMLKTYTFLQKKCRHSKKTLLVLN